MPHRNPVTDTDRQRILQLHAEGVSRNDIHRQTGRALGTVSRVVAAAGLSFERAPEIAAATEAKRVDNAAKRAEAIGRLYAASGRLFDRLEAAEFTTVGYSREGNAIRTELGRDEAPPADVRHLSATAVNMLQAAARLEEIDKTGRGAEVGKSIVAGFFDALRGTQETPDP